MWNGGPVVETQMLFSALVGVPVPQGQHDARLVTSRPRPLDLLVPGCTARIAGLLGASRSTPDEGCLSDSPGRLPVSALGGNDQLPGAPECKMSSQRSAVDTLVMKSLPRVLMLRSVRSPAGSGRA